VALQRAVYLGHTSTSRKLTARGRTFDSIEKENKMRINK
jgi:hypothetical protein